MGKSVIITFNSFEDKKPYDGQYIHVLDKWGYIEESEYEGDRHGKYLIDNNYKWCEYSDELIKALGESDVSELFVVYEKHERSPEYQKMVDTVRDVIAENERLKEFEWKYNQLCK